MHKTATHKAHGSQKSERTYWRLAVWYSLDTQAWGEPGFGQRDMDWAFATKTKEREALTLAKRVIGSRTEFHARLFAEKEDTP